jgi:hypothetical protein
MSTHYGFSSVPDRAYVALLDDLSEGAWAKVGVGRGRDAPGILQAPLTVYWKRRLHSAIQELVEALGAPGPEASRAVDRAWDAAQKRLHFRTLELCASDDETTARTARRVRDALLEGDGLEQTTWDLHAELDFGRSQLRKAASGELPTDLTALRLGSYLEDIRVATDALRDLLGLGAPGERSGPRWEQTKDALEGCAAACTHILEAVDWLHEHTGTSDSDRATLEALGAPLVALLDRSVDEGDRTDDVEPPKALPRIVGA